MDQPTEVLAITQKLMDLMHINSDGTVITTPANVVEQTLPANLTMEDIQKVEAHRNNFTTAFNGHAATLMGQHWVTNPEHSQIVAEAPFGGDTVKFVGSLVEGTPHWLQVYGVNGGQVMHDLNTVLNAKAKSFAAGSQ